MPLSLETFSDHPAPDPTPAEVTQSDEARLAGFDAGYAAGWDDAAAAHAAERAMAEARATESLQALGFTYQEARAHILGALQPLLMQMAARLLPRMAQAALPALVLETLMPMADDLSEPPVTLRLHPDIRPAIEALCVPALGLPVTLIEDATLSPGDIRLSLDQAEARIDIDTAVSAIAAALDDFFTLETQVQSHAR